MEPNAVIGSAGGNPGIVENDGTFIKEGASTNPATIDLPFHNNGTAEVQEGTLDLQRGGTNDGTFTVDTGATLQFSGDIFRVNPGSKFSVDGFVHVASGGTLDVTGAVPATNFALDNGGKLTGIGNLAVSSTFNWTGGTMSGAGTTSIAPGAVLTISGPGGKALDARTLENRGAVIWTGTAGIYTNNGPAIENYGTWDMQGDAASGGAGAPAVFTNYGVLHKSVGHGVSSIGGTFDNNGGSVIVDSGTLTLSGGTSTGGTYDVATGATISLISGPTHNISGAITGTGGGAVVLYGTLHVLPGGATLNFDPDMLQWSSGGIIEGVDTLTNLGDLTLVGSGNKVLRNDSVSIPFTLDNAGTVTWKDNGGLYTFNGPAIKNDGTWDTQGDAVLGGAGAPAVLTNYGILQNHGTSSIDAIFTNSGFVSVSSGTLRFTRSFAQYAGDTHLGGGALSGTTLDFEGGYLDGSGTVSANVLNNGGTVSPGGGGAIGTLIIVGNYTQTNTGVLASRLGHDANGPLFDQLRVTGNATLQSGSNLNLTVLDSFFCNPGDSFDVLRVDGTLMGTFSNVNGLPDCLTLLYGDHGLSLVDYSS